MKVVMTPGQLMVYGCWQPMLEQHAGGLCICVWFWKDWCRVNRVVVMIASVGDNQALTSFVSVVICLRTQASRAYL